MSQRVAIHEGRLGVRLPVSERQQAEQAAQVCGWSLSDLTRVALREYVREKLNDPQQDPSQRG